MIGPRNRRQRQVFARAIQRRQAATARVFLRPYKAEIQRAMEVVADGYAKQGNVYAALNAMGAHESRMAGLLRRNMIVAVADAAATTARSLQPHSTAKARKPRSEEDVVTVAATDYAKAHAAEKAAGVSQTTRNQLQRIITKGVAAGKTSDDVAKDIRRVAKAFSSYRANNIARTETHAAWNHGSLEMAAASGVVTKKEWVAASDERVRESHSSADGQQVELDGAFRIGSSSLQHPGDPAGEPEEVCNCRCTCVFHTGETSEEYLNS